MKIQDYLKATQHQITGGSDFCWDCFGPYARYLDCDKENQYSTNIIFDSQNFDVYTCEFWDYVNNRQYRWINPEYVDVYKMACEEHEVDFHGSLDDSKFTDLEVEDDILEKIEDMVNGKEYDNRVKVPLDIPDEDLLKYMIAAHERDMTFNEFIEEALRHAIDEFKRDPERMKELAKGWAD